MKKRIRNKLLKKSVIIVDIKSIPEHIENNIWWKLANEGLILWESSQNGEEPKIYPSKNGKIFKIIDNDNKN